jgi:hypothetical protein
VPRKVLGLASQHVGFSMHRTKAACQLMTPAHGARTAHFPGQRPAWQCAVPLCFEHCAVLQNAHNIMISRSTESPVRMTAKVTDMGLSSAIKHGSNSDSAKSVRLLSHVAPEVQRHGRSGPESDIYSFGILSKYSHGQHRACAGAVWFHRRVVWLCRRSMLVQRCSGVLSSQMHGGTLSSLHVCLV